MCHTRCARLVSKEDPFAMWSLKRLGRMALVAVWSVGGTGSGETEEKVTASRDRGQKGTITESVGRRGWIWETSR